jgi:predicted ribosome-associated RNA-binding protein Tma20
MLRDISFNGYCNIGDRLKFKIILLESNGKNIRLQMHEFLDEKLDKKTTNEITVCNIDYTISLTDTEQKIYNNNDDVIGVINMMIAKYDNNNTQYMYMLPEASVKFTL